MEPEGYSERQEELLNREMQRAFEGCTVQIAVFRPSTGSSMIDEIPWSPDWDQEYRLPEPGWEVTAWRIIRRY